MVTSTWEEEDDCTHSGRRSQVEGFEVDPHLADVVVVDLHVVGALQAGRLAVEGGVDEHRHLCVGADVTGVHW